jgi:hypothetical protein
LHTSFIYERIRQPKIAVLELRPPKTCDLFAGRGAGGRAAALHPAWEPLHPLFNYTAHPMARAAAAVTLAAASLCASLAGASPQPPGSRVVFAGGDLPSLLFIPPDAAGALPHGTLLAAANAPNWEHSIQMRRSHDGAALQLYTPSSGKTLSPS